MTTFQAVLPSSQKATYNPGDLLSFRLQAPPMPNMGIVAGSLRLSGTLVVTDAAGARIAETDLVYWDGVTGMHSLINQLSISGDRVGTIESIQNYDRAVATLRVAEMGQVQSTLDSMRALELAAADEYSTQPVAFGQVYDPTGTPRLIPVPWAIKPTCVINNASGSIPFDKTGMLEITMILSAATSFLHGDDVAGKTYALADVQMSYYVAPVTNAKVQMSKIECLYRTMPSSTASFQTRSSMVVSRLLMTFIQTAQLADPTVNSKKCPDVGITRLVFTYGDGQSLITTSYNSQEEIVAAALFAVRSGCNFASAGITPISVDADPDSPAASGYVVGSAFVGGVDARNTTIGITLEGLGTTTPGAAPVGLPFSGFIVLQGAIEL